MTDDSNRALAGAVKPDSKTDAGGADKLSERKLSCRELARYIWDRAQNSPACFEQDIARLIENERKRAALRSTPVRCDAGSVEPFVMSVEVQTDYERGRIDGIKSREALANEVLQRTIAAEEENESLWSVLASPPPSGVREALDQIDARLKDLREANDIFTKSSLNRSDAMRRNDREVRWLCDLRSVLAFSPTPAGKPCPECGSTTDWHSTECGADTWKWGDRLSDLPETGASSISSAQENTP